ncbi:MAG: choice-of-anchor P family protein [Candidatus Acidiferrales bacterium]
MDPVKKTYLYNAQAYGFSGAINRPFGHDTDVHAGTSVPTSGGFETARAENFSLQGVASYKAAYSLVTGNKNEKDGSYNALATATLEGLNILDMVTADRIVSRVASKQFIDDPEPTILTIGTRIENLRVAGCPVQAEMDNELFRKFGTYETFLAEYDKNQQTRELIQTRLLGNKPKSDVPEFLRERYNWFDKGVFASKGIVLCTLVKNIRTDCPDVQIYGNVIVVPQFGRIYLGEFEIQRFQRTLSVFRVELGSGVAGSAGGPGTGGGGSTFP